MGEKYYVAYGSNMHLSQMTYRCPHAVLVGKSELKDYVLRFRGHPYNAYATIEPAKDENIPVLIWEIRMRRLLTGMRVIRIFMKSGI